MAPTITIATRTQNRTELLPRVRTALLAQTRRDFEWVIFNDGGDKAGAEREAEAARAAGLTVLLHHSASQIGRSAAANSAVRLGTGRYVLLHDDDDALEPTFLEKTASQLDGASELIGSVTWMWRIEEQWSQFGMPVEVARHQFEAPFHSLYLVDLALRNRFAPIAFLYRRDAFEAVGGYDKTMDLLEDWDFNLRMLMRGDVGVVPENLALYYVRTNINDAGHRMSNTVQAREAEHWSSHASFHNKLLRRDLADGRMGLGVLLAMTRLTEPSHHTQASFERMKKALGRIGLRSIWKGLNSTK